MKTAYQNTSHLKPTAETNQRTAILGYIIHSHSRPGEHIRPLWLSQSPNFKIQQIDFEVDTKAGCNILLFYKVRIYLGQNDCRKS